MATIRAGDRRERGIDRLLTIVARLRGENGCPWDREQTLETLRPFLIEECYEVLDALESGDPARHCDELGDVLLQVVLQAQICQESGAFSFDDVAHGLADKMIRRHPHVFGDVTVADTHEVLQNWEKIKAAEHARPRESALDGIPRALPALQRAQRIQVRAARVGFDWPDTAGVLAKVAEELDETRAALAAGHTRQIEDEAGDLLFSMVNLCRAHHLEAEEVLGKSIAKFSRRFRAVERRLRETGQAWSDASPDELDRHWEAVKAAETQDPR